MPRSLEVMLAEYDDLSKSIKGFTDAKNAVRDEIMSVMRQKGDGLDSVKAGGYTATISFRKYLGFNESGDDGLPVPDQEKALRLSMLRFFFQTHAPLLDVPASDKIQKAWDNFVASRGSDDEPPLPPFLKESTTPVLRVSGRGAN